jgi:hypothetical protein
MDKKIHLQELFRAEKKLRELEDGFSEESRHIPMARLEGLVFRPSLTSQDEKAHMNYCHICRTRLGVFQGETHPDFSVLLQHLAGRLPPNDSKAIEEHLSVGCLECSNFLPLQLSQKAVELLRKAGRFAGLSWRYRFALPETTLVFATAEQSVPPMLQEAVGDGWTVTVEQSPDDELFVGVRSHERMEIQGVYVVLTRGSFRREAEMPWTEADYWPGKRFFSGFSDLLGEDGPLTIVILPLEAV